MDAIADKEVAEITRGLTPYMKLAGLGRARSQPDFDKMDKIAQDNLVNRFTAQLLPKKSYLKIIGRGTFRKNCLIPLAFSASFLIVMVPCTGAIFSL